MTGVLSKIKYGEARATSLIMLSKTDRVGVLSEDDFSIVGLYIL